MQFQVQKGEIPFVDVNDISHIMPSNSDINELWNSIAQKLNLKLIDTRINLYENQEGQFILTKYGFIRQRKP